MVAEPTVASLLPSVRPEKSRLLFSACNLQICGDAPLSLTEQGAPILSYSVIFIPFEPGVGQRASQKLLFSPSGIIEENSRAWRPISGPFLSFCPAHDKALVIAVARHPWLECSIDDHCRKGGFSESSPNVLAQLGI